jgi:hypothetical protein
MPMPATMGWVTLGDLASQWVRGVEGVTSVLALLQLICLSLSTASNTIGQLPVGDGGRESGGTEDWRGRLQQKFTLTVMGLLLISTGKDADLLIGSIRLWPTKVILPLY